MIDLYVSHLIYFIAVIDPIGTVPVFLAVTRMHDSKELTSIAFQAVGIAFLILLFFIFVGEVLLTAMSVPVPAFQIAGGIVLFLFALSMIFGESKPDEEVRLAKKAGETAIYPLAIPSIAGPGAMLSAVLLTENARFTVAQQAVTTGAMITVLMITLILLLLAGPIHKIIGQSGASIISRVMGIILTSVAVTNILSGIKASFGIGMV